MIKRYDIEQPPHPLYATAVRCGDTLYLSGIAPLDDSGRVVGDDAERQADKVFEIMARVLAAHGAGFGDVLKLNVYLRRIADRPGVAVSRERWFKGARPASTLLEVSNLGLPEMLLEVEAIAHISGEE